jgi:hypothetical protein
MSTKTYSNETEHNLIDLERFRIFNESIQERQNLPEFMNFRSRLQKISLSVQPAEQAKPELKPEKSEGSIWMQAQFAGLAVLEGYCSVVSTDALSHESHELVDKVMAPGGGFFAAAFLGMAIREHNLRRRVASE